MKKKHKKRQPSELTRLKKRLAIATDRAAKTGSAEDRARFASALGETLAYHLRQTLRRMGKEREHNTRRPRCSAKKRV